MEECVIDRIEEQTAPPTPASIEDLRDKQLAALQALRRRLLLVREATNG
jgi:hypothetical protein